ncbi:MAG: discoidin domain-containing protein, partial [Bacteroidetes bacterium]|nr:discoidin domain-containing protein [Bacteroidota bacterium]
LLVLNLSFVQAQFDKTNQPGISSQGISSPSVTPGMTIFTYYGTWWQPGYPASSLPWDDFTHIIQFYVVVSAGDALLFHPLATSADADNLTSVAHAHGRKVLFSCGPDNGTYWSVISQGDAKMRTLVHNLSDYAKAHNFDGVELDLEGSGGGSSVQASYDAWYQALRDTLNTWSTRGLLVCSTMQYYPGFPLGNVAKANSSFDYIMMMEYDFNYNNSPARSQDPLYTPSCGGSSDSVGTLTYVSAGFTKTKLVMGVPFYGRRYGGGYQVCGAITGYLDLYNWYNSCISYMNAAGSVKVWDDVSKSAFISNQAGNYILTVPDSQGLYLRAQFAKRQGFGGMMSYGIGEGHLYNPVPAGHKADELADWLAQAAGLGGATPSDSIAPTVSLTSPVSGDTVSGTKVLTANASDNIGVARVDFVVDGNIVGSGYSSPFNYSWTTSGVANGVHSVSARAYDGSGNSKTSTAVNVVVRNIASQTTNIALNKFADASSVQTSAYLPSYAVDGSMATRWSSLYTDPQWIMIDLGSINKIDSIALSWESAYATAYKIQTSLDNSNWTDVYSTTTGNGGWDNIKITPVDARYVRMYGTQRATTWGYSLWAFETYQTSSTTGVDGAVDDLPQKYFLSDNYPNPFNPSTDLRYAVTYPGLVSLKVYNLIGEQVATLVNEYKDAGVYSVQFSGNNSVSGTSLPSGIYFYRMVAGSFSQTKKMMLLK